MDARQVSSVEDARQLVEARGLDYVKVGLFDTDGVMRGKYLSREKFLSALEGGFGFCDVVLGWDSNDQLYDNVSITGWHTGYPDAEARLLPDTCRDLPAEGDMLLFLAEFAGEAEAVCPRGVLRRAACEFEFFLFEETPTSVREKGFRGLQTITPGFFGYSMLRSSVHADFYHDLLEQCQRMDMPLEGLHAETGPGVVEAAIAHSDPMLAADRAALFKTFTKVLAQKRGWMATFMAKWSPDWPGQSGHLHFSLRREDGSSVFYDAEAAHNISTPMRQFIAGQQALMPELLAMVAPTINSYSRMIPGFWAPTHACWGVENRTCALRAIPGKPASQRVEYRVSAADINPYLAMAAALASGLWGIEQGLEPDAPIEGNAYDAKLPTKRALPPTLEAASERLRRSKTARELFGDTFVDHYAATRMWEVREHRKAISDWELERYFEII